MVRFHSMHINPKLSNGVVIIVWFVVCQLLCKIKKKKLFQVKNPQPTGFSFGTCITLRMLVLGRKVQLVDIIA